MRRLRITGGRMKGRYIEVEDYINVRHTSSKVRESIFNLLGDIREKRVIDLFSGSAILAFEAISRDARHATVVEIDGALTKKIRENIDTLNLKQAFSILNMDVLEAIPLLSKKNEIYDIIFMDPPYEKGYIKKTLEVLKEGVIFNKDTVFVIESSKREMLKKYSSADWGILKQKIYGDTAVTVLKSELFNKNSC